MDNIEQFIPSIPGHYWYYEKDKYPIIIKVIKLPDREAWTCIDGYGCKVADLPGKIGKLRIEDIAPPVCVEITGSLDIDKQSKRPKKILNVDSLDFLKNSKPDYGEGNLEDIKAALKKAGTEWTDQGWIIESSLYLDGLGLTRLPLIKEINGSFWCENNNLTSLKGAPQEVEGNFWCDHNQLTTLEGCPQEVGGNFWCDHNQLTTLEGGPKKVGGSFYCHDNQLTSLKGCPQYVNGDFNCYNNQLTTLEGVPQKVGGKIVSDFDRGKI